MRPHATSRSARSRVLLALLALVLAPVASHVSSPRAAAIFTCGHVYCGALNIAPSGPGSGNVTSDPAGIDCTWVGPASKTGTCSHTFGWDDAPSTYVDLTVSPSASSYACVTSCGGAGQSIGTSAVLDSQAVTPFDVSFNHAQWMTVLIAPTGDGSGRVTSDPAGIDCRDTAGSTSGTCTHTWYFVASITVGFTYTPKAGSQYCAATCYPVGTPHYFTESSSGTVSRTIDDAFKLGHPIVTVAVQGKGKVTSSPAGISCPSTCSRYFPAATSLNLKATAASGYAFNHWSGGCSAASKVPTCILALGSGDVSATAVFSKVATPPPPTSTPRPGPTPGPAATQSTGQETPEASRLDPLASASSEGSAEPETASSPAPSTPAAGATSGPATGPGSNDAIQAGSDVGGIFLGVLVGLVLALILILGVGAGFLAGRRRSGQS